MTYVALLRGVNVGGKNKLPMKELAKVVLAMGCGEVRTFIQSGNIIFRAEPDKKRLWADEISSAIHKGFGLTVPVVLRTAGEMRALTKRNPFLTEDAHTPVEHLHVVFLSSPLKNGFLDEADEQRFAPDTFRLCERELCLRVPAGLGVSKLPAYLDRRLKAADVVGTTRNWRTTLQLADIAEQLQSGKLNRTP